MAGVRKSARELGKSDPLDAQAVARAAIREGAETLPEARLSGPEREIALLLDHREDLVAERTRIQSRLRWLLHDLDPTIEIPDRALDRERWLSRLQGRLVRREADRGGAGAAGPATPLPGADPRGRTRSSASSRRSSAVRRRSCSRCRAAGR